VGRVTGDAARKQLGAWYTPPGLVTEIVDAVVTAEFVAARGGRPITVVDPACGDGRFLRAVEARVRALGGSTVLHGVDIDERAVAAARSTVASARIERGDALSWSGWSSPYDLVIGNPPFLSQMALRTTRGGSSERGGGPYADVAVEFVALAVELVDPSGGRLAFVLPQSILSSRDAGPIRRRVDERAALVWSSWTGAHRFEAHVHTCAVAFEFGSGRGAGIDWPAVVTGPRGVPEVPATVDALGTLSDRATLNANFRDEYYAMAAAVGEQDTGPPLITSGLIDPGTCRWGQRPVTFARRRLLRPRLDLARLDGRMATWAERRLTPKVLVANQTSILEAVCDPTGQWLPGVPVLGVYPTGAHWDDAAGDREATVEAAWTIAAVLTSGFASAWAWRQGAGTGLSANTIRLSPVVLGRLPWPAGDLAPAVKALRRGDVRSCAGSVDEAYGVSDEVVRWWTTSLDRIEARRARGA
jgi:hypothetical protein